MNQKISLEWTSKKQIKAHIETNHDINLHILIEFEISNNLNKYPIKISSKKTMEKKTVRIRQTEPFHKKVAIQTTIRQDEQLERTIIEKVSSLDPESSLRFLDSLASNNHTVFCQKSLLYLHFEKLQPALQNCLKAFQYETKCKKCIQAYATIAEKNKLETVSTVGMLIKRLEKDGAGAENKSLIQRLQKVFKFSTQLKPALQHQQRSDIITSLPEFSDLLKSLQQVKAQFHKISIIEPEKNNRTVVAKENIKKDQTILFIPFQKMITLWSARAQSTIVDQFFTEKLYLKSPKHCQLAVYLLEQEEMGEKSAHYHYINNFPKQFTTFPVNYSQQEISHLQGSPFMHQVEQKKVDIRNDYQSICSMCQEFSRFKFEDFCRFRLIVSSRIFGVTVNNVRTDALVPIADMLNHNIPKQTNWFYSNQFNGFMIKSLIPIKAGQEIYDSYGQKCNSRFLLNYGFTLLNNTVNQVFIRIPFEMGQSQSSNRQIYREVTLKLSKDLESKQFNETMSVLRHSVDNEYYESGEFGVEKMRQTPFINQDIQYKVWQKFEQILQVQLSQYPTSLKEDRKILTSKDLQTNYRNCVILRMGEKEILHFYIRMAKKVAKIIKNGIRAKDMTAEEGEFASYLKQLNFS